jgi:hypothetical protein
MKSRPARSSTFLLTVGDRERDASAVIGLEAVAFRIASAKKALGGIDSDDPEAMDLERVRCARDLAYVEDLPGLHEPTALVDIELGDRMYRVGPAGPLEGMCAIRR